MNSARSQGHRPLPRNTSSSHDRKSNFGNSDRRRRRKGSTTAPPSSSTSSSRPVQDATPETSSSLPNSSQTEVPNRFFARRRKTIQKKNQDKDVIPVGPISELNHLINSFAQGGRRPIEHLEKFLRLSLEALNCSDREIYSQTVVVLVGDTSIKVMQRIMEAVRNPQGNLPVNNLDFVKHIVPFMNIIVHNNFIQHSLHKLIIQEVFGNVGLCCKFLERTTALLETKVREAATDTAKISLQDHNYCLCQILQYLVRNDPGGARRKGKPILEAHSRLVALSETLRTEYSSRSIDSILSEIRGFLLPERLRQEDWPGILSKSGPRHDNDFNIIDQICILPTVNELSSARPPYLPVNASDAPHFLDGPNRLFDIHFRLLREDMLGQLRPAIVAIREELKRSPRGVNRPLSTRIKDPAIRVYSSVTIISANFDKFQGVRFTLRFPQPERLRSLGSRERIRHWGEIRSLDTGALYLVSNSTQTGCFLIVTKKDEKALGQDKEWSRVNVQLADPDAKEVLVHLFESMGTRQSQTSFTLIEFTGILLPAYELFLKDLQKRSRNPSLPFSVLLCSQFTQNHSAIVIPPPSYTKSTRYYDLTPLSISSTSLRLSPTISPRNEGDVLLNLEKHTTLDAGQCKGLVAALTRELALVQGSINYSPTYVC